MVGRDLACGRHHAGSSLGRHTPAPCRPGPWSVPRGPRAAARRPAPRRGSRRRGAGRDGVRAVSAVSHAGRPRVEEQREPMTARSERARPRAPRDATLRTGRARRRAQPRGAHRAAAARPSFFFAATRARSERAGMDRDAEALPHGARHGARRAGGSSRRAAARRSPGSRRYTCVRAWARAAGAAGQGARPR